MSKQKPDAPAPPQAPPAELSEVAFELSLEDTLAQHKRGLATKSTTVKSGYNPYDTPLRKNDDGPGQNDADGKRKPKDLRKLSEWIRLQRQVEALKKEPPDSE